MDRDQAVPEAQDVPVPAGAGLIHAGAGAGGLEPDGAAPGHRGPLPPQRALVFGAGPARQRRHPFDVEGGQRVLAVRRDGEPGRVELGADLLRADLGGVPAARVADGVVLGGVRRSAATPAATADSPPAGQPRPGVAAWVTATAASGTAAGGNAAASTDAGRLQAPISSALTASTAASISRERGLPKRCLRIACLLH